MVDTPRLTRDDVAHVAGLARLHLTDEELDLFTGQLAVVLDHAADVALLDLADVPPTAHAMAVINVLRPDIPGPTVDLICSPDNWRWFSTMPPTWHCSTSPMCPPPPMPWR